MVKWWVLNIGMVKPEVQMLLLYFIDQQQSGRAV